MGWDGTGTGMGWKQPPSADWIPAGPSPHQIPPWISPSLDPSQAPGARCAQRHPLPARDPRADGLDPPEPPSPSLLSARGAFFFLPKTSGSTSSYTGSQSGREQPLCKHRAHRGVPTPGPPRRPPSPGGRGSGAASAVGPLPALPPPALRALLRKSLLERKSGQDKNNPGLAGKHGPGPAAMPSGTVPGQRRDQLLPRLHGGCWARLLPAPWHRWHGDGEPTARAGPGVPPALAAAQKPPLALLLLLLFPRAAGSALPLPKERETSLASVYFTVRGFVQICIYTGMYKSVQSN